MGEKDAPTRDEFDQLRREFKAFRTAENLYLARDHDEMMWIRQQLGGPLTALEKAAADRCAARFARTRASWREARRYARELFARLTAPGRP
jgi:hypothetical protein